MLRSHLTNDARFSVPADWEDRSVHVLTAPRARDAHGEDGAVSGGGAACSLTLHRDVPLPGEDLAAYAARQLAQLRLAFPDLDVLRQGARDVGRARGWELEFRWVGAQGAVHQHQVLVPHGGRVLTWTATAPAAEYAEYADAFAKVLASVHLIPAAVTIEAPRG